MRMLQRPRTVFTAHFGLDRLYVALSGSSLFLAALAHAAQFHMDCVDAADALDLLRRCHTVKPWTVHIMRLAADRADEVMMWRDVAIKTHFLS
jgi:hypothetical protein